VVLGKKVFSKAKLMEIVDGFFILGRVIFGRMVNF